eukprot:471097_1
MTHDLFTMICSEFCDVFSSFIPHECHTNIACLLLCMFTTLAIIANVPSGTENDLNVLSRHPLNALSRSKLRLCVICVECHSLTLTHVNRLTDTDIYSNRIWIRV